jgi:hypothetical protein
VIEEQDGVKADRKIKKTGECSLPHQEKMNQSSIQVVAIEP